MVQMSRITMMIMLLRGSDEPPDAQPAGGADEPNDEPNDEPYVYTTRRGRKLHSTPTCATLYNSRNIETLPMSVAQRRYPLRALPWLSDVLPTRLCS